MEEKRTVFGLSRAWVRVEVSCLPRNRHVCLCVCDVDWIQNAFVLHWMEWNANQMKMLIFRCLTWFGFPSDAALKSRCSTRWNVISPEMRSTPTKTTKTNEEEHFQCNFERCRFPRDGRRSHRCVTPANGRKTVVSSLEEISRSCFIGLFTHSTQWIDRWIGSSSAWSGLCD